MIRLHNLLGNKWSLITGRLPGRTANDVKNYWHPHRRDKTQTHSKTKVLKPQPYKLSKPSPRFELKTIAVIKPSSRSPHPNDDIALWESLLAGHAQMDQETDFLIFSSRGELISSLWVEETTTQTREPWMVWWNKSREVKVCGPRISTHVFPTQWCARFLF
ncbi:hypothetical protein PVL29_002441 [Vitis rotundifolia]|uniref:Uncharacterized protein n=1 Tax=Vitis rotundifolia TaxID=103349 RepID=A0AA39AI26_VITRO|nr:hypothetical protein PVL29_002441 [Vitis rotundifolia]